MGSEEQDNYTPDIIPDDLFEDELEDSWEDLHQLLDFDQLGDFDV
jgi:hypothetical protein